MCLGDGPDVRMAAGAARGYRSDDVIRDLDGHRPDVGHGAYVDTSAVVIGRVVLGARSSVWPTAVIRGDTDLITVGEDTNVQDGAVLHADEGVPCTLGARVTVGHRAVVHGCTVGDEVLIGMGAVVMNRARIGAGSIIGAGALVPEGMEVPPGSMVVGLPARVVREVREGEREGVRHSAAHYVRMIDRHGGGARGE
jgi:carbonic anhydrase/acetyltransferase-like protein (isoleucine patch superfamily)